MNTRQLIPILSLLVGACSSTSEPTQTPVNGFGALVTVAFQGIPGDTLVVFMNDTATISAAERYVATHTGPKLLSGTITRGAGVDQRYPFQFKPESVRLVDVGIEICDGRLMHTAAEVDEFFELSTGTKASTTATWCPWSSYPIKVQRVLPD